MAPPRGPAPRQLVVVGNGMVGHRLLTELAATRRHWRTSTSPSSARSPGRPTTGSPSARFFDGRAAEDLSPGRRRLLRPTTASTCTSATAVVAIDRDGPDGHHRRGPRAPPTTASCWPPARTRSCRPSTGSDGPGCFVYRTIDDLEAIADGRRPPRDATRRRGRRRPARPRGRQRPAQPRARDPRRRVRPPAHARAARRGRRARPCAATSRPSACRCTPGRATPAIESDGDAAHRAAPSTAHDPLADRPRRLLRRHPAPRRSWPAPPASTSASGAASSSTTASRTSDPAIWAIGECAAGRRPGLRPGRPRLPDGPGRRPPTSPPWPLGDAAPDDRFAGADLSTKLKLLGVDVASVGDVHAPTPTRHALVWDDPRRRRLQEASSSTRDGRVLGGRAGRRRRRLRRPSSTASAGRMPPSTTPATLILGARPARRRRAPAPDPADAPICSCENVDRGALCGAVADGCRTVGDLKAATRAGTGCGGCVPLVESVLRDRARRAGREPSTGALRALRHSAGRALRPGPGPRPRDLRRGARRPRHRRRRLRDLQADGGLDPGHRSPTATSSTASRPRSRTPTTTSSPTSRRTAPTRSCPASPAARSPPRSSSSSARWPATSASTRRSPAASASTCSAPASSSCPPSGGGWSTPASSRATPTASRCAR